MAKLGTVFPMRSMLLPVIRESEKKNEGEKLRKKVCIEMVIVRDCHHLLAKQKKLETRAVFYFQSRFSVSRLRPRDRNTCPETP